MTKEDRYILVIPARAGLAGSAAKWLVLAGLAGLLVLLSWKWVDRNLLHWGVEDVRTTYLNEAELLKRLQAFEVVSVKHTYNTASEIDVDKRFSAGPARVSLPGWIAGQELRISGEVTIAAGVDLGGVGPADI